MLTNINMIRVLLSLSPWAEKQEMETILFIVALLKGPWYIKLLLEVLIAD
jgi:hypothetical protein